MIFNLKLFVSSRLPRPHTHRRSDEIRVLVAVDLPVPLEHTVVGSRTHEVEVTLAGGEAAAHCGPRQPAAVATLTKDDKSINSVEFSLQ